MIKKEEQEVLKSGLEAEKYGEGKGAHNRAGDSTKIPTEVKM